jgi:hypothetical protein
LTVKFHQDGRAAVEPARSPKPGVVSQESLRFSLLRVDQEVGIAAAIDWRACSLTFRLAGERTLCGRKPWGFIELLPKTSLLTKG